MFDLNDFAGEFADDGFTFTPINDIIGKRFTISSFKMFTSKDKEKYNSGNERGVMLNIHVDGMEPHNVKTTTHSKVIVPIFEKIRKKKVEIPTDEYFVIKRVESDNGRNYLIITQLTSEDE